MSDKLNEPPKTVRERSGRLLKMVGTLASQEFLRRIQGKNEVKSNLNLSQVQTLVKELGHLKGAAMKLGQMLALETRDYFPEEVCLVLDQLQSEASFLDFEVIEAILKEELKNNYFEINAISRSPIAAASIGQVHRANMQNGQPLAIKVQYPGIKDSIKSDVKLLGSLMKTVSVLMRKQVDLTNLVEEFSEIFLQESNYLKEANFSELYRNRAQNIPELIVPFIYKKYSSEKVITMDFEPGIKLTEWMKAPDATLELRQFYGKLILDLYSREFCEWGLVQTDPNLGNFLFRPKEKKLVLLDFGATKEYDLTFRKQYAQLIMATLSRNNQKLLSIGEEMGLIDPRESDETKSTFKTLLFESMRPITLQEYDFSESEYPENMRKISRELVKSLQFSSPPQKLIFLHRKLSGIFYILRTLKAKLPLTSYTERFETLAC
jgi:predicted unusual protein kinase regulating ubiquinone biosynthesis (AarF/ABC1/UbiB family)